MAKGNGSDGADFRIRARKGNAGTGFAPLVAALADAGMSSPPGAGKGYFAQGLLGYSAFSRLRALSLYVW